jgi:hypothetical protein
VKEEEGGELYEQEISSICRSQVKLYEVFDVYQTEWLDCLEENIFLKQPQYYLTPIEVIGESL